MPEKLANNPAIDDLVIHLTKNMMIDITALGSFKMEGNELAVQALNDLKEGIEAALSNS